ncbi:CDP-6-deoxy-delta-3,4-glucoseen reductase [Alcaligenaceae bacterium CGII-47]|nr:CDP-6-deoxy-delta-3,4-glucoseen reductase [Alcaligenaceae bacterium CGII-47]
MSFKITVLPEGQTFEQAPGQTVLDAALAAGLVLPYSCRTGTCSSCRGKVVSGEYEAGAAPERILPPEDIAQGYTLFCQACAASDLVIEAHEVHMADDIQIRKMPVRVLALERLADDVMSVTLQLPSAEPYLYYPGQYLDIILQGGVRRSYSMASAPFGMHQVSLHIRHMPGGLFTDHVFGAGETQMKVRDLLRIEGPLGSFFLREESIKPIILLASGTGFAPICAIIEQMIAHGITRPTVLYWGGRRPVDLYMDKRARNWAAGLGWFNYVPVVSDARPEDGWSGRVGFVHNAVMADFPDLSNHQVYACGTPAMVDSARRDFRAQCALPAEEFYADAFTSQADVLDLEAGSRP